MKVIGSHKLKEIFGDETPSYAIQFMLAAPDDTSDEDMVTGLTAMYAFKGDIRIRAAIKMFQRHYVPEGLTNEQEGKILTGIALLAAAIYGA